MIYKSLKVSFLLYCILMSSSMLYSQEMRKIEIYNNPFVYRGNVNNQFTTANNKYVDGKYEVPYIFETGINYIAQKEKWGWYTGLSFMMEQQVFSLSTYIPNEHYPYEPTFTFNYDFDSYFLGYKVGLNYSVKKKLQINVGISIFDQVVSRKMYPEYRLDLTLTQSYLNYSLEEPKPINKVESSYNIRTGGYPYPIIIIPEIRFDYKIYKNTFLTLGARTKFWTGNFDYRFLIKVDGYFDSTNPQNETLHESRIKSQGIYTYIGIKYDIPIGKKMVK